MGQKLWVDPSKARPAHAASLHFCAHVLERTSGCLCWAQAVAGSQQVGTIWVGGTHCQQAHATVLLKGWGLLADRKSHAVLFSGLSLHNMSLSQAMFQLWFMHPSHGAQPCKLQHALLCPEHALPGPVRNVLPPVSPWLQAACNSTVAPCIPAGQPLFPLLLPREQLLLSWAVHKSPLKSRDSGPCTCPALTLERVHRRCHILLPAGKFCHHHRRD